MVERLGAGGVAHTEIELWSKECSESERRRLSADDTAYATQSK
jgi:hypothetical protein